MSLSEDEKSVKKTGINIEIRIRAMHKQTHSHTDTAEIRLASQLAIRMHFRKQFLNKWFRCADTGQQPFSQIHSHISAVIKPFYHWKARATAKFYLKRDVAKQTKKKSSLQTYNFSGLPL